MLSKIEPPNIFEDLYKKGIISSIVQFGSSVYHKEYGDIDLLIIVKRERLLDFSLSMKDVFLPDQYDISLVVEDEIDPTKKFFFGSHGCYLVESFRSGITLKGENPFSHFPIQSQEDIAQAIYLRMHEYVYTLRKSYFDEIWNKKFYSRYNKIIKLSAYLLCTPQYLFPQILERDTQGLLNRLEDKGYVCMKSTKQVQCEELWKHIHQKYS